MNDEQYIKMLLKFFKGKINVNGILCYPLGIFESNMGPDIIKFRMENPNDLSYTKPGLEGQLSDQVDFFNRLAGMGEHSRFNVRIENIKDIYTKNDVNDYVSSVLKGKTILRSNNYEDEETDELVYDVIFVKHKDVEYELDGDFVAILNKVIPIKAKKYRTNDKSLIGEIPLDDAISGYDWWQSRYRYDETDVNYPEFDSILSDNNRNYLDPEFQAPYVITIFQN